MYAAWSVASLTVYTSLDVMVFVFAIASKVWQAVVAGHTLQLYHPLKAAIRPLLKTRSHIPLALLGIERDWCLMQVSVYIEDMRISMLPRTHYIIYLLAQQVHSIFTIQPVLHYIKGITHPVRAVVVV
jgi:uncharacterized membrane protein YhfC